MSGRDVGPAARRSDPNRPDPSGVDARGTDARRAVASGAVEGEADASGALASGADAHGALANGADAHRHGSSGPLASVGAAQAEPLVRVVIVDDHPVVRDGLRGMFDAVDGIEVVGEAASGPESLALVAQLTSAGTPPDVVLMDLRMPGGDGIAAIRALRGTDRVWPRILVLTTYDTDRDIRASMEAGADGYLLKDARRADLVRAVLDLCAGRPALAPGALAALLGRRGEVDLTPREIEVLSVIAAGGTNRTAAERLLVSEATVKTHLLHAYAKLGVSDRAAAVRVAYERGLL